MVGPGEITADVDAQVFVGTCRFQCLTMESIAGCYSFPSLVGHYPDDVAFARVEFISHLCSHSSRESSRAWYWWSLIFL